MSDFEGKPADQLAALNTLTHEQRARVRHLAALATERLRPASLAREAGNRALDIGLDTLDKARTMARAHPVKTAGIVAAIGAVIAHRPLLRLFSSGYANLRDKWRQDRKETASANTKNED